jgi:hypothetical protein
VLPALLPHLGRPRVRESVPQGQLDLEPLSVAGELEGRGQDGWLLRISHGVQATAQPGGASSVYEFIRVTREECAYSVGLLLTSTAWRGDARLAVFDFIEGWYNPRRPALGARLRLAHDLREVARDR